MNTFIDLYNLFQSFSNENFKYFLNNDPWNGKDKLESSFRLFSYLNLIDDFNDYDICIGNFTNGTISKYLEYKDLFINSLKDKGDKSDLTLIKNKNIIATTCKNLSSYHINNLDIRDIFHIYETKYKSNNYSLILCIVIKDKNKLFELIKNAENTSKDLVEIINNKTTLLYDYNDLYNIFNKFIINYQNIDINNLIKINKNKLVLKYHQIVSISRTIDILDNYNECLWGHVARSGKSYIISGYIYKHNLNKSKSNYLIITTAPKETINQYIKIFNSYYEFNDFNIISQESIKKPKITDKNIIICSKQFLQLKDDKKTKKIKWLKDLIIDIRFIDESHNGGTTELAKSTFDIYGSSAKTIYITATYLKPLYNYNISLEQQILFNTYHIHLLKNIDIDDNYNKLIELFDNDKIIDNYSLLDIKKQYSKLPSLHYITESLNKDIKELIKDNENGYSLSSILMLKHNKNEVLNEFKNEEEVEKLIKSIFGITKSSTELFTTTDNTSLLRRCEIIAKNPEYNSRWFNKEEPLIILCFLPCNIINLPIDKLSNTLKTFIENKKLLEEYEIVCINSKTEDSDPIDIIEKTKNKAIINSKKGILVLVGKKCTLGITISKCDVVILMTNITSYDTIFQMMYRSMTEDENKKCGFVIDLDIQRSIDIIVNYGLTLFPKKSSREAIKYILEQKLICFNIDQWYSKIFGIKEINLNEMIEKIYNIFNNQSCNSINKILDTIDFKLNLFSLDDQKLVKQLFKIDYGKLKKSKVYENEDIDVKDGIEKLKTDDDNKSISSSIKSNEKEEDNNIDYFNEILKKFIPLICLITISNNSISSFIEMIELINENKYLKEIIEDTITTWCNKKNKEILETFKLLYDKYYINNEKFNNIVKEIRDIFKYNLNNKNELSKSIDKYLIPHENEKKQNAEISTPASLRKEMIDKIPDEFWKTPKKVFEPCSGKGGFLLDIVDKFMNGLKELIENEEERYRVIIEECLYFSDINKQNIFIANLLLDPLKKYKLNANEGDTLKLDIKEKWRIEGFDAVIGNPPYNEELKQSGGKPLYNVFIEYLLPKTNLLSFVIPSRWFSGGKGLDKFRERMLKRKDIVYINHIDDAKKIFGNNVQIEGGINYFLIDKSYNGLCNYNGDLLNLDDYDIILENKYKSIIKKIEKYEKITKIYINQDYYKLQTNDKRLLNKENENTLKCYVSQQKGFLKYIEKKEINKDYNNYKVITARANGKNKCLGNIFIGNPNEVHTKSYISFNVNDENKAKSLLSYLKCKLPNLLLSLRKMSQDISEHTLKWIPLVPLDREWTNEEIYKYFKLEEKEMNLIKEIKIIGYNL